MPNREKKERLNMPALSNESRRQEANRVDEGNGITGGTEKRRNTSSLLVLCYSVSPCDPVPSVVSVPGVSEFQQRRRVLPEDPLAFDVADRQPIDDGDCLADVHRALFRIERRVGSEQHAVRAEELQAARGRVVRAEERRVGVEHLEIVE